MPDTVPTAPAEVVPEPVVTPEKPLTTQRSRFKIVGESVTPSKPVAPAPTAAPAPVVTEVAPAPIVTEPAAVTSTTEAAPVADAISAETVPTTPVAPESVVEKSPKSKAIIAQLDEQARLARERKKLDREKATLATAIAREKEEAIRAKADAERVLREAAETKALFDGARGDPVKMLALAEKQGVTYQQMLAAGVEMTPEQHERRAAAEKTKELEARVTTTEKQALERLAALEKELAETKRESQEREALAVIQRFERDTISEVNSLAKEFPWTRAVGMADHVLTEIRNHAAEHGERLTTREAIAKVESRAKKGADSFLDAAKDDPAVREYVLKKLGATVAPAKPAAKPQTPAPFAAPEPQPPPEPTPARQRPAASLAGRRDVSIDNRLNTAGTGIPWSEAPNSGPRTRRDLDRHFEEFQARYAAKKTNRR